MMCQTALGCEQDLWKSKKAVEIDSDHTFYTHTLNESLQIHDFEDKTFGSNDGEMGNIFINEVSYPHF